uniref:Uncharacterized protein n=1 Tax=Cannabis sativa TaxID=3483 RepID=A0A803PDJ1_CANSA
MVVQTRSGLDDQGDPMLTDLNVQTHGNTRVPLGTNPEHAITQPLTVGHGVTSSMVGITPGVQETGNTS